MAIYIYIYNDSLSFSAYHFDLEPAQPNGHYGYVRLSRDEGQGRVCVPGLTDQAADLLCREAGYVAGMTFSRPLPRPALGPVWTADLQCNGSEVDINGCVGGAGWTLLLHPPEGCPLATVFCFPSEGIRKGFPFSAK